MSNTDALEAYSVSLLRCGQQYLLIQRSPRKTFAPGRWTGLGGRVEADELNRLRFSALREVQEEAGIPARDISDYVLRRALLVNRPLQPLRVLLYFTGVLFNSHTQASPEGSLHWVSERDFASLDIIETTRPVLGSLIRDMENDPAGNELPRTGLSVFNEDGSFSRLVWGF